MIAALLPILGSIGAQIAKSLFPDPADETKRIEVEQKFQLALLNQTAAVEKAAADIIMAEAGGDSWLQKSWRPLTMVTFVGLIVAKWLGFTAPGVTEALELQLFEIIKIGLGGYVIGRSAEKVATAWKNPG